MYVVKSIHYVPNLGKRPKQILITKPNSDFLSPKANSDFLIPKFRPAD